MITKELIKEAMADPSTSMYKVGFGRRDRRDEAGVPWTYPPTYETHVVAVTAQHAIVKLRHCLGMTYGDYAQRVIAQSGSPELHSPLATTMTNGGVHEYQANLVFKAEKLFL